MDDKAKVAIIEIDFLESATSHNCRALTRKGIEPSSCDNNHNFASVTLSLTLLCEFPELS